MTRRCARVCSPATCSTRICPPIPSLTIQWRSLRSSTTSSCPATFRRFSAASPLSAAQSRSIRTAVVTRTKNSNHQRRTAKRFAFFFGDSLGCRPNLLEGFHPSNSPPRFATHKREYVKGSPNRTAFRFGFLKPSRSEGGVWGTGAERVRWTQSARWSVGNRKERLRDYASSPGAKGDNYDSDTLR